MNNQYQKYTFEKENIKELRIDEQTLFIKHLKRLENL